RRANVPRGEDGEELCVPVAGQTRHGAPHPGGGVRIETESAGRPPFDSAGVVGLTGEGGTVCTGSLSIADVERRCPAVTYPPLSADRARRCADSRRWSNPDWVLSGKPAPRKSWAICSASGRSLTFACCESHLSNSKAALSLSP